MTTTTTLQRSERLVTTNRRLTFAPRPYHNEGVSDPQRAPAVGARRDHDGLTVNCNHHGWGFTHGTPARTGGGQCECLVSTMCLKARKKRFANLLMKGLMLSPVIGAMLMGMGSGEVSQ